MLADRGGVGVPPQWTCGSWVHASGPATERLVSFISGKKVAYPRDPLPLDNTVIGAFIGLLLLPTLGALFATGLVVMHLFGDPVARS